MLIENKSVIEFCPKGNNRHYYYAAPSGSKALFLGYCSGQCTSCKDIIQNHKSCSNRWTWIDRILKAQPQYICVEWLDKTHKQNPGCYLSCYFTEQEGESNVI